MTAEQQAFLDWLAPLAQKYARPNAGDKLILPSMTIAQGLVESAWGTSLLAKHHNYFGIKANKEWSGPVVSKLTGEVYNGQAVKITAAFRAYPDREASVADHRAFLMRSHYAAVWDETDYKKACKAVKAAGYATALDYAENLIDKIERFSLSRYDTPFLEGASMQRLPIETGIVQGDSICGVPFTARIVAPNGLKNVRTGIPMVNVIGITNHNTANKTASAEDHARWLQNVENADQQYISVHFFVDEDSIVQTVPINEVCYHAGDGKGDGNRKTIAVEICEDGDSAKAEANAQKLNAALILTYPGLKIYKHQDWSGKVCPRVILGRKNGWAEFVASINRFVLTGVAEAVDAKNYRVKVTARVLNIRSAPNGLAEIVGKISDQGIYTIVQEVPGWGRLKSGKGWIALAHTRRA